jgi:hypothetical protein
VVPGSYRVALALRVDGVETPIGEPQTFRVAPIGQSSLPPPIGPRSPPFTARPRRFNAPRWERARR